MNVGALIERLLELDPLTEIGFTYDYGDYCHTDVVRDIRVVELHATKFNMNLEMTEVAHSKYIEEDDDLTLMYVIGSGPIAMNDED